MTSNGCLLIVGAGGHGRVAADIALKMGAWDEILFADDHKVGTSVMGIKVVCNLAKVSSYIKKSDIFVAIGANKTRALIQNKFKTEDANLPVLIHPSSVIGYDVELGAGSIVMAGAVINCQSKLGEGCIVNTGASIDHDNCIGNFVHISPGAHLAGNVVIGDGTWLGIGSVVSNNISIIGNTIIGAGGVVVNDINQPGTYVGIPARRL